MRSRLNVLNVYDCLAPESLGGVEQRNLELATALARRGHRVTLAGWGSGASRPPAGVNRLLLPGVQPIHDSAGRRRIRAALRFALESYRLELGGFDLVDVANIPYLHLFPLAARCRRLPTPLVVTWHEYWGFHWRRYVGGPTWPAHALTERLAAGLGAEAVAVSRLTAERLGARRDEPVTVIPNGVSVERIRAAAAAVHGEGPPLIYAGRLITDKRVDLLLRAVRRLKDNGVDRRFRAPLLTVVGDGPDRPRLEGLAVELGISEAVVFRGKLPLVSDVWLEIGGARIAVQPSGREGFGLFPLEAMAAGLPVVYCASSESAVSELVRDGREGVRSHPEPEALAAVLAELLSPRGAQRRAELGRAAAARAEAYDWDSVAARVEELYLGLVDRVA